MKWNQDFFFFFFFFFFLLFAKSHYLHYLQYGLNISLDNTVFYLQYMLTGYLRYWTKQDSTYNLIQIALNITVTRLLTNCGLHATKKKKKNRKAVRKGWNFVTGRKKKKKKKLCQDKITELQNWVLTIRKVPMVGRKPIRWQSCVNKPH